MKKRFFTALLFMILTANVIVAQDKYQIPTKETVKHQKEVLAYLDSRLHFTQEQKNAIRQNNQKYRRELEKIIKSMQKLHDEIRDVYILGIPKYQADFRTAGKKAQLVILKQNAKYIRDERRKAFDSLLDDTQKIEFEKIKKEIAQKNNVK